MGRSQQPDQLADFLSPADKTGCGRRQRAHRLASNTLETGKERLGGW